MKKLLLFALRLLLSAVCFAQEVVFDPQHTAAVIENGIARGTAETTHNNYLNKINGNLNTMNANVSSVVIAQTMIYNALADVNSALKDGMAVKNMAVLIENMISYLEQCLDLAQGQPYLLLFAEKIENEMRLRAVSLVGDVSAYILKGNNVLADYNSRDQLLRKVTQQLQILDSLSYGAWRTMYWAKERGIIASVNPYAGWISKDKNFVNQIISNTKYLK
jgi:molybdenum cofactor biosynthesis enzyme MoaA